MKMHCSSVYNEIMLLVTNSNHISYWQYWIILTLKGNISCSLSFYCIFIAPERNHILKNGFQMCTRHILTISASFSAFWNNGQMRRMSGWLESWLMRPAEEEEEEFTMATKPIESIKSATALRAVGRLKEFTMTTKRLKSNNVANCTSCSQPP